MLERFDMLRWPFRQYLNAAVIEVLYITDDLMSRGGALRKETITHALHLTSDKKLTCNWRHIRQIEFNTSAVGVQSEDRENQRNFFLVLSETWRKLPQRSRRS
jgi:hypothetical protein